MRPPVLVQRSISTHSKAKQSKAKRVTNPRSGRRQGRALNPPRSQNQLPGKTSLVLPLSQQAYEPFRATRDKTIPRDATRSWVPLRGRDTIPSGLKWLPGGE